MEIVNLDFEISVLNREQKEQKIKNYFKSFGKDFSPNFSNFSFTSPSSISDYQLKYIGAISLLSEFTSGKEIRKKFRKERSFFFVFLKGNSRKFKYETLTDELFEVCNFFAKSTMITIVFLFDDETIQVKFSPDNGKFQRTYNNQANLVLPSLNFVKSPDAYISKLIDRRKYLIDCYSAYSNDENKNLPFIDNDYLNTQETYLKIINSITNGKKIIFVEGPAGAGKTILALRLLGFYDYSCLLIINEYFDQELKSIFDENKEKDIRFFNHRGKNSTEIIKNLSDCYDNQIPIRDYFERFNKFIYKKYWNEWEVKNEEELKKNPKDYQKNFWNQYNDPYRTDYKNDLIEFKEIYLQIDTEQKVTHEKLFIVDEGQRIYNESIIEARKLDIPIIVFGDLQQKINPKTDNLKMNPDSQLDENITEEDLSDEIKNDPLFELISIKYPIRISESALEKIRYLLALTEEKKQFSHQNIYPIKIFETCETFIEAFKTDRTNQKFIGSYQDMWRHEKESTQDGEIKHKRISKVSRLTYSACFEFEDGFNAYHNFQQVELIASYYGKKNIDDMKGMTIDVVSDTTKEKRYRILVEQMKTDNNHLYYGLSEISRLYPSFKTISKVDSNQNKDKLLIDPKFKSSIFTPYELISREVRNIYLYLPKSVTIVNNKIIDQGPEGGRFFDEKNNTNFLLNQLYVLLTRATNKVFIYCESKTLNDYFKLRLNNYQELNQFSEVSLF